MRLARGCTNGVQKCDGRQRQTAAAVKGGWVRGGRINSKSGKNWE